jgi:hypothetical protein
MQEREHYRPASQVGTTCDCCTVDIGYPEIPRLVQLPSGKELEVCGGCARAISNGDYSTIPEVSQL